MTASLKSLELIGYKTFATRTIFEFSDTVTCIVGPNGSGKSNIADSIRWVLGEQSYSLLRGKKTEDMIFSGSESRPRSGMASATILFDNSHDWLGIEFSDVAITRRAYRDGDNEYLLNNQRVRLKDITELLSRSGLAERTYTVIGQGLVDAALALKAEERRRLFEEAAGIGLHRSRKEEALRRLEITRRNLERVQDILVELKPRLTSLERQAKRAQEYDQVKIELRELLKEWYGYHWQYSQKEVVEAIDIAKYHEKKLLEEQQKIGALEEKSISISEDSHRLRNELNLWHRESAEIHLQRESLNRRLAIAEQMSKTIYGQAQDVKKELENLETELNLKKDQIHAGEQEQAQLEADLIEFRNQLGLVQQELNQRIEKRNEVEKKVVAIQENQSVLNVQLGERTALIKEIHAAIERDQINFEETKKLDTAYIIKLQKAENFYKETEQLIRTNETVTLELNSRLNGLKQKIEENDELKSKIIEEQTRILAQIAELQARVDVLEQAESNLIGYTEGTQLLLHSASKNVLLTIRGSLNNYINVPIHLEPAIVSILGEFLDATILERDADKALDILKESAMRGVIVPLDQIQINSGEKNLATNDDILSFVPNLIQTPDEIRPVIEALLGNFAVVRNRKIAKRVRLSNPRISVVTLDGEVYLSNGLIISGGRGESDKGKSILSRKREIRDIKAEILEKNRITEESQIRLNRVENIFQEMNMEVAQFEENLSQKRQENVNLSNSLTRYRVETEEIRKQIDLNKELALRLQSSVIQNTDNGEKVNQELTSINQQVQFNHKQVSDLNSSLNELSIDEFQAQLAHWVTLVAVGERALSDNLARQDERNSSLIQINRLYQSSFSRLNELKNQLTDLEEERRIVLEEETKVRLRIDEIQKSIEPLEAELEKIELQEAELQNTLSSARKALSSEEHQHAQARIILARRQEGLQSLRRRIEDDYGLVAFDYLDQVSGQTPLPFEGLVEQLPKVESISLELEDTIKQMRATLRRIGPINAESQTEYLEVKQRYEFLENQIADLQKAEEDVRQVINELDHLMEMEFRKTYEAVAEEFKNMFTRLFGGGSAQLILSNPEELTTSGIDIDARLPGRRTQGLSLLSGGERSLTAMALIFALLKVSPTPFCLLDEVDAMLDEANTARFRELLKEMSENTQFVIVTHNRNTVQVADVIYGVTMGRDSISQVLSLKLDEIGDLVE